LKKPDQHIHGFYRPNLYYQVEVCANEATRLSWLRQAILQHPTGRVLIYCGTRKQTEELVNELGHEFPDMGFYHAGMDTEERNRIQGDYEDGKIRILAATNAFGMGIDHPDVRLVAHYQMPARIEALYQEMGRAGRDGRESTCLMLYAKKDKGLHSFFIRESDAPPEIIDNRWRALDVITQYAEGGECRHSGILTYFRDAYRIKACGHCDICAPDSPRRITLSELFRRSAAPKRKSSRSDSGSDAPLSKEAELRYEVLRDWRKEYAEEHEIPAFLVFSNKTLRALAVEAPESIDELEEIYGMGPHKIEHLGSLILDKLDECR
jgi:ATP-dependent DNA helicase RecQ